MTNQDPIQTVRTDLTRLDRVFTDAAQERQRLAAEYRSAGLPLSGQALTVLLNKFRPQVDQAAAEVRAALTAALQSAGKAAGDVRKREAEGPEGALLAAAIPAWAAIIPRLDADQVSDRLELALNDGRKVDAAAIAELAPLHVAVPSFRLRSLLHRASQETKSPELVRAEAVVSTLEGVQGRVNLTQASLQRRLSDVVELGQAPAATGYSVAWLMGETGAPNASFLVK